MKNIFIAIATTMLLVACSPTSTSTSSSNPGESSTTSETSTSSESSTTTEETTTTTTTEPPIVESSLTFNTSEGVESVAIFAGGVQLDSTALASIEEGTELVAKATVSDHFEIADVKLDDTNLSFDNDVEGYPFIMPGHDATLTVSANQVEFQVLGVYSYQTNYDYEVTIGGEEVSEGQYVRVGTEISIVVSTQYSFSYYYSGIYVHVNDEAYTISEDLSDGSVSSYEFTVAMPSADATIAFAYNNGHSVSDSGNTATFNLPDGIKVYGWGEGHLYDSYCQFVLVRESGYKIDSIKYQREGSEDWTDTTIPTFTNDYAILSVYPTVFAGCNITFDISASYVGTYEITYVNADKVTFGSYDITATKVIPGDTVYASQIGCQDGYRISNITIEGVDATPNKNTSSGYWGYNFTMPENNVTITFEVGEIVYAGFDVTTDEGVQSYYFSTNQYSSSSSTAIDQAESGSQVYLYVTLNTGYSLGDAVVTHSDGTSENVSPRSYPANSYALTMPSDGTDLIVSITTTKTYLVSIEANSNVNSIYGYPKYFAAGSVVEIYFNPSSQLYTIDDVTIKELPDFDTNWDGKKVSFEMPEQDITLVATTSELETMSVNFTINDPDSKLKTVALIQGSWTNATTSADGLKILGDYTISLNVYAEHGYQPVLSYVADGKTVEVEFSSAYYCNFSYSFKTPATGLTEINLSVVALSKVNVTIDDQTGDNVEGKLTVNGAESTADSVYLYDTVAYTVTSEKPSGFIYSVSYYATVDGEKVALSGTSGVSAVYDNLTIEITKVEVSSLTINSISSITVSVWNNTTSSNLSNGSVINAGDVLCVDLYNYSGSAIDVIVTVSNNGEQTSETVTVPYYYSSWSPYTLDDIIVAGDVVITITLAA